MIFRKASNNRGAAVREGARHAILYLNSLFFETKESYIISGCSVSVLTNCCGATNNQMLPTSRHPTNVDTRSDSHVKFSNQHISFVNSKGSTVGPVSIDKSKSLNKQHSLCCIGHMLFSPRHSPWTLNFQHSQPLSEGQLFASAFFSIWYGHARRIWPSFRGMLKPSQFERY